MADNALKTDFMSLSNSSIVSEFPTFSRTLAFCLPDMRGLQKVLRISRTYCFKVKTGVSWYAKRRLFSNMRNSVCGIGCCNFTDGFLIFDKRLVRIVGFNRDLSKSIQKLNRIIFITWRLYWHPWKDFKMISNKLNNNK